MKISKSVAEYISKNEKWKEELSSLREIILKKSVNETVKWKLPVYTVNNKNVMGLGAFKSFVGLWFFQGALLKDHKNKLINAQKGVTKALRQWRFASLEEIREEEETIEAYIEEAISNQEKGREIKPKRGKPVVIPEELKEMFSKNPDVKESFEELSLTKKREFAEYIGEAKREETKKKRLNKIKPMILSQTGLNDRYR